MIISIVILAILGAAMGSFINVLIYRLPRKESIIFPGSHCGSCRRPIPFYHNIPVVSYLVLGGKCKYCAESFHWHHLLVEIITPLILIGVYLQSGGLNLLFFKYALLALWMIPIFFIDAFHQIIPHKLSIPLIAAGLVFALIPGSDVGILAALIAALVVFIFLLFLAYLYSWVKKTEGLGGGDIWLFTAVASFMGPINLPFLMIVASLLGLAYFAVFIRKKDQLFAFGTFISFTVVLWIVGGLEKLVLLFLP